MTVSVLSSVLDDGLSDDGFAELGLSSGLLGSLVACGYTQPTAIQVEAIPHMLRGVDVLAQAQTGTGKTAAFALPLIDRIEMRGDPVQVLVLTPTRELALQVATAFQKYGSVVRNLRVACVYGGQSYRTQSDNLRNKPHVVVGTPGRIIDQIERGNLVLSSVRCVVIDEADEMLNMGFIDDVELIIGKTPEKKQVALFSATMPSAVRRIADNYLKNPVEIRTKINDTVADTVNQRYCILREGDKFEALTRIIENETSDAAIIFVKTKMATLELADKLSSRGFLCAALNGDMEQKQREFTVEQLKNGKLNLLIATDVAARGLDVKRVTHVFNYDVPNDPESYVHRIGRTGRAGRRGEAVLFLSPGEQFVLRNIERNTRAKITQMKIPSFREISTSRVKMLGDRIAELANHATLSHYEKMIEGYVRDKGLSLSVVASALLKMAEGSRCLFLEDDSHRWDIIDFAFARKARGNVRRGDFRGNFDEDRGYRKRGDFARSTRDTSHFDRGGRGAAKNRNVDSVERVYSRVSNDDHGRLFSTNPKQRSNRTRHSSPADRYRLDVGAVHGARPGNIVGAIANEIDLNSKYISNIRIYEDHSTVDLPVNMPKDLLALISKAWVGGRQMKIAKIQSNG